MKKLLSIAGLLLLMGCGLTELPQGNCGDGYVTHTSPAGTERCIKPGMRVGDGVMPAAIGLGLGVAAVGTGVVVLP